MDLAERIIKAWAAQAVYAEHAEGYRNLGIAPFTAADVASVEFEHECADDTWDNMAESYATVRMVGDEEVRKTHRVVVPDLDRFPEFLKLLLAVTDVESVLLTVLDGATMSDTLRKRVEGVLGR